MATTTATISISSDISSSYPINISKTMTMSKAGVSTGIDETTGLRTKKFTATTAAVTFTARESVDTGTVVIVDADIVVNTAGNGTAAVSSAALGTKSLSDIYVKPSVHTGMTVEYMLFYE